MIAIDETKLVRGFHTGIVHYQVTNAVYDQAYFNKYVQMGQTTFGVALNSLRAGLVSRYLDSSKLLVDIGAGDGAFMRARRGATYGFDINPATVAMLTQCDRWFDAANWTGIENASFWDSLEHIPYPPEIIRKIVHYCFVSIPVFRDLKRIQESKHFRPTEHYWYFTRDGLIAYFWELGFVCLEMNDMETALGRENIGTFVFRRR